MKIACLGWGSLIWKPENLPVAWDWKADGPHLPIEFTRISDGGELATVISLNATPVPVLWAWLDTDRLDVACEALRRREGIPEERCDGIGSLLIHNAPGGMLIDWARERDIDALLWTDLPPRSEDIEGRVPSVTEAILYLDGLSGEMREHARDYMQRVPAQIDTTYRRAIMHALGWD
ncbi:hypothetical protein [Siccibacter colletis]|uniref:hypothetical protein n=1 Tax=Siccibacter colletis TaxID=1505757 RepID=UPI0004E1481A|nr:hypothetical protein [Siccibacter colletis]